MLYYYYYYYYYYYNIILTGKKNLLIISRKGKKTPIAGDSFLLGLSDELFITYLL